MSMGRRVGWLVVGVALLAAACGGAEGGGSTTSVPVTTTTSPGDHTPSTLPGPLPANGELARGDVERVLDTGVTDAELADLVAGNTEFAFDLFEEAAASEGGNVVLSPYSVAAALTMTYAGARGDTAAEMRDVLTLGLPDERVHAARNELDLQIAADPGPVSEGDAEPFAIRVANSLWGQAGYPFLDEFLELLARDYDAGMNLVDFMGDAEAARVAINDWVEEQTAGRIVELLSSGTVDSLTRLVLVNAIWFKAGWMTPFDPEATADGTFTLLDGSEVTVPLMHASDVHASYTTGDGYEAVQLPYGGDASMLLVVSDEGRFDEVAAGFGPEELASVGAAASMRQVNLTMPKFEFRSQLDMNELLEALGMVEAFQVPWPPDGADFTGIVESRELFISHVMHQAFISVDEKGTEAAAATAVVMSLTSAGESVPVTVDRPFLFFIQHDPTGEILFMGQVTDPR